VKSAQANNNSSGNNHTSGETGKNKQFQANAHMGASANTNNVGGGKKKRNKRRKGGNATSAQ